MDLCLLIVTISYNSPVREFMVDEMASFGLNSTNTSRTNVTGYTGGLNVNGIKGSDTLVSLGVSRRIDFESLRLTPYARATWQMVNLGVGVDNNNLINPTLNTTLADMGRQITTPRAGGTFALAGLYGTVKLAEDVYGYAGVSGDFRSGSMLVSISLEVRVKF